MERRPDVTGKTVMAALKATQQAGEVSSPG